MDLIITAGLFLEMFGAVGIIIIGNELLIYLFPKQWEAWFGVKMEREGIPEKADGHETGLGMRQVPGS